MKRICLLIIVCAFTFNACTVRDEVPVETVELSVNSESAKIEKLTQMLEELNSTSLQTRGRFWDRFKSILYSDACGYSWGRKNNLNWKFSLISGGVASLINIVTGGNSITVEKKDAIRIDYAVDIDIPMTKSEVIGATHNEAIVGYLDRQVACENMRDIQINETLVQEMNYQVNQCLSDYEGEMLAFSKNELIIDADFPVELQTELLDFTKALAQQDNLEDMHQFAKELLPSERNVLDLLEQSVIRFVTINDKEEIRDFVIQLNSEIDKLGLSTETEEYLKTVVSIAENSYALWNSEE